MEGKIYFVLLKKMLKQSINAQHFYESFHLLSTKTLDMWMYILF